MNKIKANILGKLLWKNIFLETMDHKRCHLLIFKKQKYGILSFGYILLVKPAFSVFLLAALLTIILLVCPQILYLFILVD